MSGKEERTAVFDEQLQIEVVRFQGLARAFPNHFHDYYVIGLVESGSRRLICQNREYSISKGDVLLFNPNDCHACSQSDGGYLDYRGLNIRKDVMQDLAAQAGLPILPGFSPSVIHDEEIGCTLGRLHQQIMEGDPDFGREESLLCLIALLMERYAKNGENRRFEERQEVEKACQYMEGNYAEHLSLEQICQAAGFSKSALLRAFVRHKGITPYCYLETIRIGQARTLLEQGISPVETALRCGFCDQSHFTNSFTRLIGLAPGQYRDLFREREAEAMPKSRGKQQKVEVWNESINKSNQ